MKKLVPSFCFLSALALFLSVGISLNAQQTTPQAPPDPQAQQPTADQAAPPPASNQSQAPAQAPSTQTPDQATPPSSAPNAQAQATGVQSFSGMIVKSGDKYMLKDEASGQTYDVDHQDEVQKYEGKRVKVHGTLDPSGKMIHLQ